MKTLTTKAPFLFIFILNLVVSTTFSQNSKGMWLPGYYISQNTDTIKGLIEYRNWNYNPVTVRFKERNEVKELTPSNVALFHVEDADTYQSYSGQRMIWPGTAFDNTIASADSVARYDSTPVFLRAISKTSKASLWHYASANRMNFFLKVGNEPVRELVFAAYLRNNQLVEDRQYRRQLQEVFGAEVAQHRLQRELETLDFQESDLGNFLNLLSGKIEKRKKLFPSTFGVSAGVVYNNYRVVDKNDVYRYDDLTYKSTLSPQVGISYTLYRQRNFGRYFLNMQLNLSSYTIQANNGLFKSSVRSGLAADLNLLPGFNIRNKGVVKWGIAGGVSIMYLSNNSETFSWVGSENKIEINNASHVVYNALVQTWLNVSSGWSVWANYYPPVSITSFVSYKGQYYNISGGLTWNFKNKTR